MRGGDVNNVTDIADINHEVDGYDFAVELTEPEAGFNTEVTYRISYTTCTPDGQIDPEGTEYTNEAVVEGESTGVIGVEQDWAIGGTGKSGWVHGGEYRDGEIEWTVEVPGSLLAGEETFTLEDSLSGDHALCLDENGDHYVQGLHVIQLYGPSWDGRQDIELDAAIEITDGQNFAIEFSIPSASDFEFQGGDYRYLIRYDTCATTDGLPEGGTTFGNEASVDGNIVTGDARVPDRASGKNGWINSEPVEIGGETFAPQTTLSWEVEIPGEVLADLDSDLILTDELTEAHQVCEVDGDLATALNLRVEARDQISGGGLATVDLLDLITVESEEDTLTFTIEQPTLELPGGGEATGFSHEYRYVLSYTTCTTSGGMDVEGTQYGNDISGAGFFSSEHTVTQTNRAGGTGVGVARGSVEIVKDLADTAGADFVPEDAVFTVTVQEFAPDSDEVYHEYTLDVPLNGEPVAGFNARGNGWTIVVSETDFPDIPGVVFGEPVFADTESVTPLEGGGALVELTPQSNVLVELTNLAETGALEIEKVVDGPAAHLVEEGREFGVTAQIDVSELGEDFPAQEDVEFTISEGEGFVLDGLPVGATVIFAEEELQDGTYVTWGEPEISPNEITVEAGHVQEPALITVTNVADYTLGTFAVAKEVTGPEAENPAVPESVEVLASWTDLSDAERNATLTLPTDGTSVPFGEELPVGTEVELTEVPLEDGSGIVWAEPTWSGDGVSSEGNIAVVTIGEDDDALVSVENHAATSTAGISLLKTISGEAAGEIAPETEFPVTIEWTDIEGTEHSLDVDINAVEQVVLDEDFLAGTELLITEGERPEHSTVDWGDITISGEGAEDHGDGSATVIVSDEPDAVVLVTITNEATWAPGTFSLSKDVLGVALGHADVPNEVSVLATWVDEELTSHSEEISVPTDGSVVPFGHDLAHGTDVTLTELDVADSDSFVWNAPQWDGDAVADAEDGTAVLTVAAGTSAEVALTNSVTELTGTVEIAKHLSGEGADLVPSDATFPVTVTWVDLLGDEQEREVEVSADEPVVIEEVLLGTEVRLHEGASEAQLPDGVEWISVEWGSDDEILTLAGDEVLVTLADAEEVTQLHVTNEFSAPEDEEKPGTGGLPVTGSNLGLGQMAFLVGVSVLLIGAGAWLVVRRRGTEGSLT